jgi:hypothetical protein
MNLIRHSRPGAPGQHGTAGAGPHLRILRIGNLPMLIARRANGAAGRWVPFH